MSDAGLPLADSRVGASESRLPLWVSGIAPLVLLALLVVAFLRFGPVGVFQQAFPPVEELTIERIALPRAGLMQIEIVNGGPEPVTIAQLMVDDANWVHEVNGPRTVQRLERRRITVPYPWVEGEPHQVTLLTSTGLTFSADIAVATRTPAPTPRYFGTFALLGIYAGVIPVFIGLLWLPFLRGVPRRWIDFFLSVTIGLLVFLGVDALHEANETAVLVAGAFQGSALVLLGFIGTVLALTAIGRWRSGRGDNAAGGGASYGRLSSGNTSGFYLAGLIALGIGLHNFGEGLVIGTSYASGEIALGTFLVVGFLLHNTTEGLGIVAPLADERPSLGRLMLLGAIAGVPTVLGAWIGGFTYSPTWTTLFFAIGAGAIAQVVWELWRLFARRPGAGLAMPLNATGLLVGMLIMYVTGLMVPA